MRLLAAALVSTTALLAPPRAPSTRKPITRTTRRHAVDAVTRHILLSQRPRRFDGLLQVPEEERRVGPRDDAVVTRQSDHHSFFDAHARQSFRQVDYLRFRRSYS